MFETDDILTLDDGKDYVVVKELTYNNKQYVCMAAQDDPKVINFSTYTKSGEDMEFNDVEDPEVVADLMKIIHDQVMGGTF